MLGVGCPIDHIVPFRSGKIAGLAIRSDPFDERSPVAERAVHNIAVAASADSEVAAPVQRTAARFDLTLPKITSGDMLYRASRRLVHAQVDPLACAIAIAGKERAHGRDRAIICSAVICLKA